MEILHSAGGSWRICVILSDWGVGVGGLNVAQTCGTHVGYDMIISSVRPAVRRPSVVQTEGAMFANLLGPAVAPMTTPPSHGRTSCDETGCSAMCKFVELMEKLFVKVQEKKVYFYQNAFLFVLFIYRVWIYTKLYFLDWKHLLFLNKSVWGKKT